MQLRAAVRQSTSAPAHNPLLEAALEAASLGHPVIPLFHVDASGRCHCETAYKEPCQNKPGKHPRYNKLDFAHGLKDATLNPALISTWWTRWPDANIGMRCDGLNVLDVDPANGGLESWQKLAAELSLQDLRPTVTTGSGGSHFYFSGPPLPTHGDSNVWGPGLDYKSGEGAYVLLPPSNHISGGFYRWPSD